MDLYGSWDSVNSNSNSNANSGTSTPVASTSTAAASATPSPDNGKKAAPTLEQELEQMGSFVSGIMGKSNLGSVWGNFRRQSATALKQSQTYASNAAKDFTPLMEKAKAELDRLGEQAKASAAAGQAASTDAGIINPDAPSVALVPNVNEGEPLNLPKDLGSRNPADGSDSAAATSSDGSITSTQAPVSAAAFFSRLQSQLSTNPNFQSFQHNFSTMQAELKSKVDDFSKIDMAEAQRRAEAAMNQGEKYFKTASTELSDLFGQAVRIVPPEEAGARGGARGSAAADKRKKDAAVAAAGRKETLLHRVRSDPAVLLVDPAEAPSAVGAPQAPTANEGDSSFSAAASTHADTREAFARFCQKIEEEQGGLESEKWKERISEELSDEDSGHVLKATLDTLVPSKLPAEAFWTRYFFRVQQIEEDEARRREILEGAAKQEDDDFSWDMEDESVSSVAGDVETPVDVKGKGKAIDTISEEPASNSGSGTLATPKLASSDTLPSSDPKVSTSSASSDIDDSWGGDESASKDSPPAAATSRTRNETTETKASTPRNSSEEGTTSSYDMVSAGSSPKLEKKESASTLKKDGSAAAAGAEEDEDSDWE